MFFKIGALKNFAILPGKHLCWSLFLRKLQETPTQVFSCEYWEIFKNSFFYRKPSLRWLLLIVVNKEESFPILPENT